MFHLKSSTVLKISHLQITVYIEKKNLKDKFGDIFEHNLLSLRFCLDFREFRKV